MECETFFPPAIIGGLIVGIFALAGVFLTHIVQNRRDKKRQQEIIQGVLYAIYEELNGIYEQLNSPEVKSACEKYENPGKKLFDFHYPVPLDYLIIYRANANLIGEINEPPELRRKIVSTYMLLQTLMEKYRTNNALSAQYKETKNRGEPDSYNMELYMQFAEASQTLQESRKSFMTSTEELFYMLRKKLPQLSNQDSADE